MRWVFPAAPERQAEVVANELSLHPVVGRILVARGLDTPDAASEFLRDGLADLPDPFRMKGMDLAVRRLVQAVVSGQKITLYGDYDVDGVTSTSTLATFLRALGARVATYIPHRIGEGYGLNVEAVERIAGDGTDLLVTLDCGISAVDEIARAGELGLEVIVVDHHQVGPSLPKALAILNPHQSDCPYPCKHLCAAGIAFMLCMALRKALREGGFFGARREPNLREYLDLVALGTVADVVPLVSANRIIVKHGLVELARSKRPGIRALKTVAGIAPDAPITAGQIGFKLGPRINAAGRLDDASLGVELLCATDDARAFQLADMLDRANSERQAIERQITEEAMAQAEQLGGLEARGLVLASEGWHPGVVGIVASRLVERFHRPTFVIAMNDGSGKGSGRSIESFHLFEALQSCAEHLTRFGGHKHAAGLSIEADALPSFREAFERVARQRLTDADLVPKCRIDAVVETAELNERLAESLERLAPFGSGNPEPVLASLGLRATPRVLPARNGGPGHLKLAFEGARQLDSIGFGMEESAPLAAAPLDAAFHFGIDEWNGVRRLKLRLKQLRSAA